MEKKKVLILIGIPNFNYSNKQSAVLSYLKTIRIAFENKGCEVEFSNIEDPEEVLNAKGKTNSYGFKSILKSAFRKIPYLYHSIALRQYFKAQNQLLRELKKKRKPDLIVEFHSIGSVIGSELASFWKCNLSIIFDAPTDEQFLEMHQTKTVFWKEIGLREQKTIESANKVMVYSEACNDYLKKKYNPQGAINILPCVVNKGEVERHTADIFTIGFIGSFLKWHKVEELVLAFNQFTKRVPEAKLQLIGKGEEWQRVKDKVRELGLKESVEMPGFVSEEQLNEYKSNFSVAIMPGSNWYGSPLKLFEYAAAEIPFISPSTPTVKYIFNNEHCRFLNSDDLTKSIELELFYMYENKEDAARLGANAKQYVEQEFNSKIYCKKLFVNLNVNNH